MRLPYNDSFRPSANGFPDLSKRTFNAVDRIIIRKRQSRDRAIGFGPLACPTSKQIPLTTVGIGADNSKVRAGTDVLVSYTSGNYNHIAGTHLNGFAMLAAESQSCRAMINTEHFVRCAVIMSKGIDAVSPRIAPIILRKALLNSRSAISYLRFECLPIQQYRKDAIRENAVVFEAELLRLNEFLLSNHGMSLHM